MISLHFTNRCVGATDAEIEFGVHSPCAGVTCPRRHVCMPSSNVCLSRLQTSCPQHVCGKILREGRPECSLWMKLDNSDIRTIYSTNSNLCLFYCRNRNCLVIISRYTIIGSTGHQRTSDYKKSNNVVCNIKTRI